MKAIDQGVRIRGFSHVRIRENGKIVGDSGYVGPNQVVNLGFNDYLAQLLGDMAGSKQIVYVALGTGTEPGAAGTSLEGEIQVRQTITAATSSDSKKLRCTATFNSGLLFCTTTQDISNIGLFAVSTAGAGTIFAGNTYASSSCASNQQVEITYDIDFT